MPTGADRPMGVVSAVAEQLAVWTSIPLPRWTCSEERRLPAGSSVERAGAIRFLLVPYHFHLGSGSLSHRTWMCLFYVWGTLIPPAPRLCPHFWTKGTFWLVTVLWGWQWPGEQGRGAGDGSLWNCPTWQTHWTPVHQTSWARGSACFHVTFNT